MPRRTKSDIEQEFIGIFDKIPYKDSTNRSEVLMRKFMADSTVMVFLREAGFTKIAKRFKEFI